MIETDKDLRLIKRAFECYDWNQIGELEEQAESTEVKQILHDRKIQLYRREEAFAGLT